MAESFFNDLSLLTTEQLLKYLEELGIVGTDLDVIAQGGYNGKTILLLFEDKERLYKLKLTDSSIAVLEDLYEKFSPKEATGPSEPIKRSATLRIQTSQDLFTSFGLGYGVDAVNLNALQNCHGRIRTVLSDLSNVEERPQNRRDFYEQEISSIESFLESAHMSVSDVVGKVLSVSAEAEYSRLRTEKLLAKGEKMTTRIISFKPFNSREYRKQNSPTDSNFEDDLALWIIDSIPDVKSASGSTAAEKLEKYLQEHPENLELAVDSAYLFLVSEKITHYIQAIDLGAAKYSLSIIKESTASTTAGLSLTAHQVGDVGSTTEVKKDKSRKLKTDQTIGDIENVTRNQGEQVVGAKLAPIFTLLTKRAIKQALQKATVFYLHRASGPFIISCGEHNDKYLSVAEAEHKKKVIGVEAKDRASIFYIQSKKRLNVFNIMHYGNKEEDRFNKSAMYLKVTTRFGYSDGPLEIGGVTATCFILQHPSKECSKLSMEFWERDGCYIQIAPRRFHIASYLGFDEKNLKTICVRSLKSEGDDNIWLRFQLHRFRKEYSEQVLSFGSSQDRANREVVTGESTRLEDSEILDS